MKAAQRVSLTVVALLPFASACSPEYPPPPGYVEACYGKASRAHPNGDRPKFIMWVPADEPSWPQLAQKLKSFAAERNLKYFDVAVKSPGLHMLSVSLCTAEGLWIDADKRIWDGGPPEIFPHQVPVLMVAYLESYDWERVAVALEQSFADWPVPVRTEWLGRQKHGL